MKSRHLPETDLANLAFKPPAMKEKELLAWLRPRQAKGSYDPFRNKLADAVNQQLPLYDTEQVPTPWEKLEEIVARACRGDSDLIEMNITVARSTHDFSQKKLITAEPMDIPTLTLVAGQRYNFGVPLLIRYDGGVSVVFVDLRRTGQLSPHGRRVVFSAMHQRFRENFPEFSRLRLEIWRYMNSDVRSVNAIRHSEGHLYTYDELTADFLESYSIMNRLRLDAEQGKRQHRGDDFGPLFGT